MSSWSLHCRSPPERQDGRRHPLTVQVVPAARWAARVRWVPPPPPGASAGCPPGGPRAVVKVAAGPGPRSQTMQMYTAENPNPYKPWSGARRKCRPSSHSPRSRTTPSEKRSATEVAGRPSAGHHAGSSSLPPIGGRRLARAAWGRTPCPADAPRIPFPCPARASWCGDAATFPRPI